MEAICEKKKFNLSIDKQIFGLSAKNRSLIHTVNAGELRGAVLSLPRFTLGLSSSRKRERFFNLGRSEILERAAKPFGVYCFASFEEVVFGKDRRESELNGGGAFRILNSPRNVDARLSDVDGVRVKGFLNTMVAPEDELENCSLARSFARERMKNDVGDASLFPLVEI